ncbi:MAG: DsrE family protein [Lutibacter sp.]|uniref:DsrE family protein n=1 Tax=Lutibacter sp. TaxID=1925666 RepID=UPI00385C15A3
MKNIILLLFLVNFTSIIGQEAEIIKGYGKVYSIKNPDLLLKTNTEYKIIFDIFTDKSKKNGVNPLLNTVARYLNMHAQQGVLLENMKIVIILHGAATKYTINDIAFENQFEIKNPNSKLLQELKKSNVELFVCGQSYVANGFKIENKSSNIKLALSALTALVHFQTEGYQIINFN